MPTPRPSIRAATESPLARILASEAMSVGARSGRMSTPETGSARSAVRPGLPFRGSARSDPCRCVSFEPGAWRTHRRTSGPDVQEAARDLLVGRIQAQRQVRSSASWAMLDLDGSCRRARCPGGRFWRPLVQAGGALGQIPVAAERAFRRSVVPRSASASRCLRGRW